MDMMYKRIVTLGMISVTSLLGWIYCVLNFKDQPVYIVIVSLIFVISVYVLLNALRRLKLEKEIELKETIQNTANEIIEKSMEAAYSEESERLAKATYVQLRRISTTLNGMNESAREEHEERVNSDRIHQDDANYVLTSTINKAAKVLVKYNTENNDKLLASLSELCEKLEAIKIPEVPAVQETKKTADVIPFPNVSENVTATEEDNAEEAIASDESAEEPAEDPNRQLTADEIAALFAAAETPAEEPTIAAEPVDEEPTEDPNRQLTADEIAALFAAAETPAEEPAVSEQSAIAEESVADELVEDSNRQLTAAEIEALFAAAESKQMEEEPKEEPPVTEEPAEDPNRQLTAAEIEALFAAAESKQIEEETKEEPPVAEEPPADPNRPLTPDEIAALFASMGS